jgi:cell division protein FtsL
MTPPTAAATAPAVRPRRPARGAPVPPARRGPAPRRVSGPARSGSGAARSGPARPAGRGSSSARARPAGWLPARISVRGGAVALPGPGGLAHEALAALAALSRNRLLDRLIRGRAWIGLVAFALIGIVAMQLWVVKLGVGIGRALEHSASLQRENSALAIEDSALAAGERIESLAAAEGMVVAPPGALHFDRLQGSLDARLAAAALAKPVQGLTLDAAGIGAGSSGAGLGTEASAGAEASAKTGAGAETSGGAEAGAGVAPGAVESGGGAASSGSTTGAEAGAGTGSNEAAAGAASTAAPPSAPTQSSSATSTGSAPASPGGASAGETAVGAGSAPLGEGGGTQAAPGG